MAQGKIVRSTDECVLVFPEGNGPDAEVVERERHDVPVIGEEIESSEGRTTDDFDRRSVAVSDHGTLAEIEQADRYEAVSPMVTKERMGHEHSVRDTTSRRPLDLGPRTLDDTTAR